MEHIYMTQDGYNELKAELLQRTAKIRPEISVRIAEARAMGDLSENAEYHSAREEASKNESKIEEISETLKKVKIIAHKKHTKGELFAKMTLMKNNSTEVVYTLVSNEEADIRSGKISIESAVGALLLGKSVGDEFSHKTPAGEMQYRVISIE